MFFEGLINYLHGKLEYDWQLWIDSDIVFSTEKFWQVNLKFNSKDAITYQDVIETVKDEKGEPILNEEGKEPLWLVNNL